MRTPLCVIIVSLFLILETFNAKQCVNLKDLRSQNVIKELKLEKLGGMWYEVAYHDVAQFGSTCQFYDKAIESSGISEKFGFTYLHPGAMKLFYQATNETGPQSLSSSRSPQTTFPQLIGFFDRYADYPVANHAKFPSVIVDFSVSGDGEYTQLVEYLCYSVADVSYEEVRVGSREPSISKGNQCFALLKAINSSFSASVAAITANLISKGIVVPLQIVNHTNCQYDL